MKSIKELYKIGHGPSSSHTMGPQMAVKTFLDNNKDKNIDEIKVYLYGSLALTGKGHLTDYIIDKTLENIKHEIIFDTKKKCNVHPNTMQIIAYEKNEVVVDYTVYSVGGGVIKIEGESFEESENIYPHNTFDEIKKYCKKNNITIYDYVIKVEGEEIIEYLSKVWCAMKKCINEGLKAEGVIPGKLKITKKAKSIYENKIVNETNEMKQTRYLSAYAYAVNEMNASGGANIVTAPTCGASGTLPAVLYYMKKKKDFEEIEIIHALATAGLIGNLVKTNASISGAECGCQAEVGTACSMAAAAYAQLLSLSIEQIEVAAEIAMEHHLGLTCDPIKGYVQIPCIERNAVAAMRAVDSVNMAMILSQPGKISFDMVVDTMYETGKDLHKHYRETSEGGLAKKYCRNKYYNNELNN